MRNRGQHGLYDGATHRSKGRTVLHQEHLDAKDTDGALSQSVDRPLRVLLRTLVDAAAHDRVQSALIVTDAAVGAGRRAQRGVDDVAHAVAMNRLDGRVRARLARRATDHHDGDLLDERRKLLGVEAVGKRAGARCRERRGGDEGLERGADGLGLARTKDVVAAAIVGEVARLEQVRVAELLSGLDDGGDERAERVVGRDGRRGVGRDGEEGSDGDATGGEVDLLQVLVLDCADDAGRREHLDALAGAATGLGELVGDLFECVDVDVLNLDGDDVDLASELADLYGVGEGAVNVLQRGAARGEGGQDLRLRDLLGRGGDVRVEGHDGDGHGARCLEEHAAQLASACRVQWGSQGGSGSACCLGRSPRLCS